jgi:hypothetical protein
VDLLGNWPTIWLKLLSMRLRILCWMFSTYGAKERHLSPEALALLKPAAPADTDVVAHRDGEGVDHVLAVALALLEEGGQDREEGFPEREAGMA